MSHTLKHRLLGRAGVAPMSAWHAFTHWSAADKIGVILACITVGLVALFFYGPTFTADHYAYASPFRVMNPNHEVRQGDVLVVQLTRCNYYDKPIFVNHARTLKNLETNTITVLEPAEVDLPPGCETVQSRLNIISLDTPPGRTMLTGSAQSVNRWGHTVVVGYQSEVFTVVPRVGAGPVAGPASAPLSAGP